MPDRTVYAGISPDTKKPMYAMTHDLRWDTLEDTERTVHIANSPESYGHSDWRLPTKGELNALFNNRAAIGGFAQRSAYDDWHWSSSSEGGGRWAQRFSNGDQVRVTLDHVRTHSMKARLVRSEKAHP